MLPDKHLAAAIAYVTEQGDRLQRHLLQTLLNGVPMPLEEEARDLWLAGRNRDGGWGAVAHGWSAGNEGAGPSGIAETVRALDIAYDLGLGVTAEVRSGLLWLSRNQQHEGCFVELPRTLSPNPLSHEAGAAETAVVRASSPDTAGAGQREHASQRDASGAAALSTALALHALDTWVSAVETFSEARERAYSWLCAHITSWGEHPLRTAWLVAAAAVRREGRGSTRAAGVLAHLSLRLGSDQPLLSAAELAELITLLARAGCPPDESPISSAITQLLRLRRADGAFALSSDISCAVDATIASLRALALTRGLPNYANPQ